MMLADYTGMLKQNKYVFSLFILVSFFLLSKLILFLSEKVVLKLTRKTKTEIDDLIVSRTERIISLLLIFIGFRLALYPLGLNALVLKITENLLSSLIIIVGAYALIVIADILIDNWIKSLAEKSKSNFDKEVLPLSHRFSKIFFSIIAFLFVLVAWGVQIGPLLTSLGIAGIAVALALQTTLGNVFAGLSMIFDKSIKVGDPIELEDGSIGTIADVGLRSTKIKTLDSEIITISNSRLADSKILNFQQPDPMIRIFVDFSAEYGSDASKVRKLVLDTLKKVPKALKKPEPQVLLMEMGDYGLKFRVFFWIEAFNIRLETRALATEEIYNALAKAKIKIPFPTRTVYLKKKK